MAALPQLSTTSLDSFVYQCTFAKSVWSQNTCFNETNRYFNPMNISSEIQQTTTILLYYLRLNNTAEFNMTASCIKTLSVDYIILSTAKGGSSSLLETSLPATLGFSVDLPGPSLLRDGELSMLLNLTSVRTTHKKLCDVTQFENFTSQSCKSILFLSLNVTNGRRMLPLQDDRGISGYPSFITGGSQSLIFLNKNYQTYIFTSTKSNLTEKVLFMEPLSIDCKTCQVDLDPNLMLQLCFNVSCTPPVQNNTIRLGQALLLTVSYRSAEYLYKYDLMEVQVYDNGALLDAPVDQVMIGTVSALRVDIVDQVNITAQDTGLHQYEVRAFSSERNLLASNVDNREFVSRLALLGGRFQITYYMFSPNESITMLSLLIVIVVAVGICSCGVGIAAYLIYRRIEKKYQTEDDETKEQGIELELLDYTEKENERIRKENEAKGISGSRSPFELSTIPKKKKEKSETLERFGNVHVVKFSKSRPTGSSVVKTPLKSPPVVYIDTEESRINKSAEKESLFESTVINTNKFKTNLPKEIAEASHESSESEKLNLETSDKILKPEETVQQPKVINIKFKKPKTTGKKKKKVGLSKTEKQGYDQIPERD